MIKFISFKNVLIALHRYSIKFHLKIYMRPIYYVACNEWMLSWSCSSLSSSLQVGFHSFSTKHLSQPSISFKLRLYTTFQQHGLDEWASTIQLINAVQITRHKGNNAHYMWLKRNFKGRSTSGDTIPYQSSDALLHFIQ